MTIRNHPIEAEELMAYLDGELGPEQATVAAAHLETCMECQQLAADLRGVSQTLNTWELQPINSAMPKSMAAAVEEHLPVRQPAFAIPTPWYRSPWLRSWTPAVVGCALVATIVAGVVTSRFETRHQILEDMDGRLTESQAPAPPAAGPMSGIRKLAAPGTSSNLNGSSGSMADKAKDSFYLSGRAVVDQRAPVADGGDRDHMPHPASADLLPTGPMIIRTAELSLSTREFDKGRAQVEEILKRHRGYVATLNVTGSADTGRSLTASLRIPSTQLDSALTELKSLGRPITESRNGQEVSAQYVDLQARLNNSRNTEHRLIELLQNRTGKLSDVLEVENELARVRGEIESMEAERKNLSNQVDFATVNLTLTEDYRAQLQVVPPSTSTRLINAAVEGYRSMIDGLMSVALFFLSSGPTLLLWAAILFLPARFVWKRLRRNLSGASL